MLRVPVKMAIAGMRLASEVQHPRRPGTVLLRTGFELDDPTIRRLEEMSVPAVWVRYPGLDDIARFIDPEIDSAARGVARQLERACDAVVNSGLAKLEFGAFRTAVAGLLESLTRNPGAAFLLHELGPGTYEARHAANVCMTSLLLGVRLEQYVIRERRRLPASRAKDVTNLGVGAMLADLGMLMLPREVRDRFIATGDEEDPEFQAHVKLGFDAVKEWADPSVGSVVLNHHQRWDGSGFPVRMTLSGELPPPAGGEIHVFHRIVAAADVLDRLRYPPGGEAATAHPTVRALRQIREAPWKGKLDPIVALALLHCVPAFTPGMLVRLSDGRMAAVVDWNPLDPCRPVVQLVPTLDPGKASEARRMDLKVIPRITIAEVDGFDVRKDLFFPAVEDEFNLGRTLKRLENKAA